MIGKLWGVDEVAEYLGVSVNTVYSWRSRGYGPVGRPVGKYVKFDPADVHQWFIDQGVA